MAKDKYTILGDKIFAAIGGPENVASLNHCMTRVRISIIDDQKVDVAALKQISGVLGVVNEETLQVVLGPGVVNKVAQAMVASVGVGLGDPFPGTTQTNQHAANKEAVSAVAAQTHAAQKAKLKQTWWRAALKHISAIFIPLIPAFVGAGLISGIAGIMGNMQTAGMLGDNFTEFITVLKVINSGLFTYLNIYVGINTAREFGGTPGLGGIIGGLIYLPGVVAPLAINNVFTGQPLVAGQGGIIGVIFSVWLMALVEKKLHQWIPDAIDIIVVPFVTLLIMGVFTIFLVMPFAGWISSSLVGGINWVLNVGGAFAGFVLGLTFLPMVMFGLHQILTPIHLEMIKELGSTPLLPILAMAGGGQVGAAIALWLRAKKNKQLTRMIKGALPVGILGVGEPLIYGVTLPLGRPFITACIGGGIGGAVVGLIGNVGAITIGPSGLALIPLIANNRWLGYVLGLLAAYIGGFIVTYFFGVPKTAMQAKNEDGSLVVPEPVPAGTEIVYEPNTPVKLVSGTEQFVAPATGDLEPLTQVKDDVFAKKIMGDGYAVEPQAKKIVAPVSGTIMSVTATKHAWTMISDHGLEIIVHLGLDTVELAGKPFDLMIKAGDKVKAGQVCGEMDLGAIEAAGKATTIATVITNMAAVAKMTAPKEKRVAANDPAIEVDVRG